MSVAPAPQALAQYGTMLCLIPLALLYFLLMLRQLLLGFVKSAVLKARIDRDHEPFYDMVEEHRRAAQGALGRVAMSQKPGARPSGALRELAGRARGGHTRTRPSRTTCASAS